MLRLKHNYKTRFSKEVINTWVEEKAKEWDFYRDKPKFSAIKTTNGFEVERLGNDFWVFVFCPVIKGEFKKNNAVEITVRPTKLSMFWLLLCWGFIPIAILTYQKVSPDGIVEVIDFYARFKTLAIFLAFLTPGTWICAIWPNYRERKWIEWELKLTGRAKKKKKKKRTLFAKKKAKWKKQKMDHPEILDSDFQ